MKHNIKNYQFFVHGIYGVFNNVGTKNSTENYVAARHKKSQQWSFFHLNGKVTNARKTDYNFFDECVKNKGWIEVKLRECQKWEIVK